MKIYFFCHLFLFTLLHTQSFAEKQDCNFLCDSIPPMEESYLQWGKPSEEVLSSESIKIAVWNIYKSREENFEVELQETIEKSDILLLQEVYLGEGHEKIFLEQEILNAQMCVSFFMKGDLPTGVLNLSKSPLFYLEHQRTSLLEPFVKSPKSNMLSLVALSDGRKVLLINIHGLNRGDEKKLLHQLELTRKHIEKHTGPIVFAGDFNTRNKDRQKMTDRWMNDLGLKRINYQGDNRKKALDHIYYKGLQLKNSHIVLNPKGSDHPLLWAEFSTQTH